MSNLHNVITYSGAGQAGVWNDPSNWAGGVVPGTTDTAFVTKTAVLNGPIEVGNLMLLGAVTETINGQVKTDSTNDCTSFMVCAHAVANFQAGSQMTVSGGFLTGINSVGTVNLLAAGGGKPAATLSSVSMRVGQQVDGVGTVNVAGVLNVSEGSYVGDTGLGTVNVTSGGRANFGNLVVGVHPGAVGNLNTSGSGTATVAGYLSIGRSLDGSPGGIGNVSIAGTSRVYCDHTIYVNSGSRVALSGGTLAAGPGGPGIQVGQGATISGYGTLSSLQHGLTDDGIITSSGGTLIVTGNMNGMGALQIGAGSTLDLNASKIAVGSISFIGANDTLQLSAPLSGLTFSGFAAGDQIVVPNVDALSWNGTTDVLTLSEHGQIVDHMNFTGAASGASFHLGQGASGAVITMVPPANTSLVLHH